jgi:hypothetical protein
MIIGEKGRSQLSRAFGPSCDRACTEVSNACTVLSIHTVCYSILQYNMIVMLLYTRYMMPGVRYILVVLLTLHKALITMACCLLTAMHYAAALYCS